MRDTGIGIPPDKQRQILGVHAGRQLDDAALRRHRPGLAIAQRLVELMGGRLWVESAVGRGSTFHFTAVFEPPHDRRPASPPEPKALEGLRVLVVDDNATNRRILEEMLASWHMSRRSSADARIGAGDAAHGGRAPTSRFHVVITDCQMPDVDGFTLARRITTRRAAWRSTPIVMLTSVGPAEERRGAGEIGVDAYLTKPVKHSDLLDALATLFGVADRHAQPRRRSSAPASRAARPLQSWSPRTTPSTGSSSPRSCRSAATA